ncbi:MAG TPA: fatty acid desaturase [Planctomycetota bacterium]
MTAAAPPATDENLADRRAAILARLDALRAASELADVKRVVPPECYRVQVWRGLFGAATSLAVAAVSVAGLLRPELWMLYPLFWLAAGTGLWGLFVIGHECGHGSFSASRRFNHLVGHLVMLPVLYPFHSWRLQHNHHHANTNRIDKDIDWCPLSVAVYKRMTGRPRRVYRGLRQRFWWLAVVRDLFVRTLNPANYRAEDRSKVRFSIALVALFAVVAVPAAILLLGPWGFVKVWLIPWFVAYAWFALITLLHHTHPEVPNLDRRRWSKALGGVGLTVYCRFPRWLEYLMHDINVHVPHHVSTAVPFYHLRRAHAALAAAWPEHLRETRASPAYLRAMLRECQLYDRRSGGFYTTFAAVDASKQSA